jgi:hypothetical protein
MKFSSEMKVTTPAPCISVYENIFLAETFIEKLENEIADDWSGLSWSTSSTGLGTVGDYRTSLECDLTTLLPPYPKQDIGERFVEHILRFVVLISQDYQKNYMLPSCVAESWRILKYMEHAEYHSHYDHSPENQRVFSLVAFLGQPESGGELEFPHFGVKIPPKNGSIVIFPSNFPYMHIAHPVTKGIKYSLVTWFR